MCRTHNTDVYMDDYHLLEYEVSRMYKDCKVQFVGKSFGSDEYAIGLPKNSWMRVSTIAAAHFKLFLSSWAPEWFSSENLHY